MLSSSKKYFVGKYVWKLNVAYGRENHSAVQGIERDVLTTILLLHLSAFPHIMHFWCAYQAEKPTPGSLILAWLCGSTLIINIYKLEKKNLAIALT